VPFGAFVDPGFDKRDLFGGQGSRGGHARAGRGSADALVEHACFTIPRNDSGAICANAVGKRAYATIEAESAHLLSRTMTFHAVQLEEGLDIAIKIDLRGKCAGTKEPKGQHQERAKSTSGARRYAGAPLRQER
jgi:hypothetical protein